MALLATPIVDTTALWKIILASVVGGAGVVIAFGLILLGLARAGATEDSGTKLANYALSAFGALFCLIAVVAGIYAMAKKPKSKPTSPPKSAQLSRQRLATARIRFTRPSV